jgi:hypothetical protein
MDAALDATCKCTLNAWSATVDASFLEQYGIYLGIALLVVGYIVIAAVTIMNRDSK